MTTTNRVLGPTANPQMADLINKAKSDVIYSLNAVQIGTIESYDADKNTASISINFKRQLPTGEVMEYPLLVDCPVFILSGGDCDISMPITSGDQCIILFNDRDIDNWHYSGSVDVPSTPRAHSLSDGFALVGVRNLKTAKPTSTSTVRINAGGKKVAIKNDAQSLKPLLDELFDQLTQSLVMWLQTSLLTTLQGLQVQMGTTPLPLTPQSIASLTALSPALTTLTTNLNMTKTKLGQLLDEGLS
jgi:hypothetical protein